MKMRTANYIAYCQLKWATQEKIPLERCTKGYTKRVEDNIFNNELHPETKKEYKRGKGHELDGKRAHMKALHSSSALVVNVFDYWRRQNRIQDIARCCGAEGSISMEFEKTQRDNKDTHLDIYLEHCDIWDGIPKTKALAESISQQSGARTDFEYLDVPQLIKHVLGLTCSYRSQFSLLYLWYKINSNEAEQHEEELARFSISIKDEISFQAMTYQDLFNRIRPLPDADSAYLKYLERRYFSIS